MKKDKEIVIDVKDMYVRYKTVKAESIKKSFFSLKKSKVSEYEAVRGVSFQICKGEIVGLIGKNGSGKSTTLRAIAGIFSPDKGSIDIGNHTISLMSIGVGFDKALTGKDNIYLSGLMLGFTKEEIQKKYKEIVEFSELGDFINAPVRTYSSGMHSKLAFSITAVMETDIILIDEILSVGDVKFKRKSLRKMKSLMEDKDRTVVIVSHSLSTIKKLCTRVIWLNNGSVRMDGEPEAVIKAYKDYMLKKGVVLKKTRLEKREERLMKMLEEDTKNADEAKRDKANAVRQNANNHE